MASRHDDSEGNGLSLRESWLATRQDIKYLKEDMERMKAKYANLENENPTQQVQNFHLSQLPGLLPGLLLLSPLFLFH